MTTTPTTPTTLHHVQIAMPTGGEPQARHFYGDLLGLTEIPKPSALAGRGGCWFRSGALELHLGVENPFQPARKAHPGILLGDLDAVRSRLAAAGIQASPDDDFPGFRRVYVTDPFGNRIELMTPASGATPVRDDLTTMLNDTITLRRATREDLPAIVTLLAHDVLGTDRETVPSGGAWDDLDTGYLAGFAAVDADPAQDLVVGTAADGQVVATMQLTLIPGISHHGGSRLQIEAVRVADALRGTGVGSAMIAWAVERGRAKGCHLVQLTSNGRRTQAHAFYERLGFVPSHVGFKLTL